MKQPFQKKFRIYLKALRMPENDTAMPRPICCCIRLCPCHFHAASISVRAILLLHPAVHWSPSLPIFRCIRRCPDHLLATFDYFPDHFPTVSNCGLITYMLHPATLWPLARSHWPLPHCRLTCPLPLSDCIQLCHDHLNTASNFALTTFRLHPTLP